MTGTRTRATGCYAPAAGERETAAVAPVRILIADDHKIVRDGLRALLEREPDFRVVGEASNGRDQKEP